ncbi:MAG: hypothetical protein EA397_00945 [Deltaproteobacteria bacterium]|nr:MAG: hypothetical protein EA397_00945 [Deltaproteobacteria bacterium]
MTFIAMLLLAAAVAYGIARFTRAPSVPLLVAAGLALKLLPIEIDEELLEGMLLLGLALLLFAAGAELDERRTRELGRASAIISVVQFLGLGAGGYGIAWLLGYPPLTSFFVALTIAASSSLIAVRLLHQKQQFFEPFGRLTLGVLLIQTVLALIAMAALAQVDQGMPAMESSVLRTLVLGGLALLASRTLTPWLLLRLGLDEETLLLGVLAVLFAFVGLAWTMELPLAIGAFCAGYAVSPFPVNGVIRGQLRSVNDFFLAMFFTALGASFGLPNLTSLLIGVGLALFVLIATPALVSLIGRATGLTSLASVESGLLLAQTSEISLVIALFGRAGGHVSDELFAALTLCAVITMSATPLIAREEVAHLLLRLHPFEHRKDEPLDVSDHLLVLGCGENTFALIEDLLERGFEVVVIDDDAGVVDRLRALGAKAVLGDATNPKILSHVRIDQAKAVLSTLRRVVHHERVAKHAKEVPFITRAFDEAEAAELRKSGEHVVCMAEITTQAFMAWLDERAKQEQAGKEAS